MAEVTVERFSSAPLDKVFQVAREVEHYPEWLDYVRSLKVLERSEDGTVLVTEWQASLPMIGLTSRWKEKDEWDISERVCRFYQIEGDFDQYEGIWTFEPDGGGTRMRLALVYHIAIPIGGPLVEKLVKRLVEQMLEKFLEGIARRAETEDRANALQ
ncbi:MAG: SRPBCC family protein [Armatimonadota bacterium]|nr:SRPBCC family protein [Armatimonadota bacterium]